MENPMRKIAVGMVVIVALAVGLTLPVQPVVAQPVADPLSSWKDGPNKKAILDFVKAVTTKGSPDYVPPADRIATFDNDGTLWCEKPTVEIVFTLEKLKALAAKDPTLKEKQPFKAGLEGDKEYLQTVEPAERLRVLLRLMSDRRVARQAANGDRVQLHCWSRKSSGGLVVEVVELAVEDFLCR
jgi:hypothetical protein